jgi:menaquinol-cytochrome c reductase iron-sulfur subunit
MDQHDNMAAPERRSFLGILSGLIAAGIGAVMTATIGRYALQPALTAAASDAKWTDIGALTGIEEGKMVKKNVVIAQDAGWGRFETQRSVWIVRKGEDVKIFSSVCPHLGCAVNTQNEKFVCACHGSYWDPSGKLTAGPSPRDLDTLEHRVEGGVLQVRYQSFRQGISAKEVAA